MAGILRTGKVNNRLTGLAYAISLPHPKGWSQIFKQKHDNRRIPFSSRVAIMDAFIGKYLNISFQHRVLNTTVVGITGVQIIWTEWLFDLNTNRYSYINHC